MVVMDLIDDTLGYGQAASMLVAGVLLLVIGLGHVLMPETSVVGGLASMLNGVSVSNSLSNLPGVFVRVVGAFVAGLGYDILKESL